MGSKIRSSAGSSRAAPAVSTNRPLVIALPKGRILKAAVKLFAAAGHDLSNVFDGSRKLVYDCAKFRVLVVRATDVPTYVDYGAADIGVAGRDTIAEHGRNLYEPLDLRIGPCRMVVAEPHDRPVDEQSQMHVRIATKYPVITRNYLESRGLTAEVIKLSGAIELGPLTGLADRIVDLVESGETLRQNGLKEVGTIMHVTSRLLVNPASLKLRPTEISQLIADLEQQLESNA